MLRKNKTMLFLLVAAICTMCFSSFGTFAADTAADKAELFTVISIPYAEGSNLFNEDYQKYSSMRLRYADDKTPIPLSAFYDGYFFATVPTEYKDRAVEVYFADETKFNDYTDDESYEFYIIDSLAECGVMKGDENGNANPKSPITRAEAVAMTMRLIGVDSLGDTNSGFLDVPQDEWYAKVITKAKQLGIVKGDSETEFNPDRNVSREEIAVMTARAVWCAGLQDEKPTTSVSDIDRDGNAVDADKVSDWARSAYRLLEYSVPSEFVETDKLDAEGAPIEDTYYHPQYDALRWETAEIITRIIDNFQVYPSRIAVEYGFDKEMPVMDGSTSTYPFTEAIYGNLFSNGNNHKSKPAAHSKSHASYEKVINGDIDMMIASVYPAEDILALAKEKGVELELIPIAYDAMVFFTNADNPATNLTTEQITDIYVDNKYANWNEIGGTDALLYPYARNYDSGSHAQMERHFLHGKDINDKIRQETTSVSMANVLTDVMGAETTDPKGYALGYSIYYYFKNMDLFYNTNTELKLLSINGVYPSDDTIADGSYPLSNNTYIVLRKDTPEDSPARRMAKFMLTDSGQECVELAGFGKLKK